MALAFDKLGPARHHDGTAMRVVDLSFHFSPHQDGDASPVRAVALAD
jgi:hypothetical protein